MTCPLAGGLMGCAGGNAHFRRPHRQLDRCPPGLEAIVAWGEAQIGDLDDRLMIVDFLLVVWVGLAWLELQEGAFGRAAELIAWAEGTLGDEALQSLYPDRPDAPNDTRHRLRARLLEARA